MCIAIIIIIIILMMYYRSMMSCDILPCLEVSLDVAANLLESVVGNLPSVAVLRACPRVRSAQIRAYDDRA